MFDLSGHRRGVAGGGWEDDPEESCDSHMSGDTSGDSNVNQIERSVIENC